MNTIKTTITAFALALACTLSYAQSGPWHGSIDVQGQKLLLVFNLPEPQVTDQQQDADQQLNANKQQGTNLQQHAGQATVDVPDQGAKGIPAKFSNNGLGLVSISIPSIGASFEGLYTVDLIAGKFKQAGMEFPMTLKPGLPQRNRPQTPKAPFPYETREVTFQNGNACLSGTLSLPQGYDRSTPVLVMVTGSGIQNRDEEIFDHKPFAVIADALARAGIATLRYDDRGAGKSTGDLVNVTTDDFKNDALAGVTLMRESFDHVGVLGHSEGGTYAVLLAAEGKIDFTVSLAGMMLQGGATLIEQNRDAILKLAKNGNLGPDYTGSAAEKVADEYARLLGDAFNAITSGTPMPNPSDYSLPALLAANFNTALRTFQTPYMKTMISLDAGSVLDKVNYPVLALNGTLDTQVDCEANVRVLIEGLAAPNSIVSESTGQQSGDQQGRPSLRNGSEVYAVQGVNHLFQHCKTGELSEYKEIEETISPEVLDLIIGWIKGLGL